MLTPTKLSRIAYIVAFVITGFTIIAAVLGPVILLPVAFIPLIAGIGILRRRVWSAYGLAIYFFAQLIPACFVLFRAESVAAAPPGEIAAAVEAVLLGCLFYFAGRSLASAGATRGRALPWIAVSALCTLPALFVQAFVIPTGAMENTLLIGDRILVQRFPKPSVTRGDIIVLVYPVDRRETFVKRVIGVSGDRIKMIDRAVYRNGKKLDEPYANHKIPWPNTYRDNFPKAPDPLVLDRGMEMLEHNVVNGEVVVPEGSCFVLGDNRDQSLDSRYWGFVASGDVIGKPLLIYDSEIPSPEEGSHQNPLRWHRTRWERLFKLL